MNNLELLNTYTGLAQELQEEYSKPVQDFKKQAELQVEFSKLRVEIFKRMGGEDGYGRR